MAITKARKNELVAQYVEWVNSSRAVILSQYTGLNMKQIDELRSKAREAGGEFHVVKNTLTKIAFEQAGLEVPEAYVEGSTAIGFAFQDAPSLAKALSEFARTNDSLKIKGGYLGKRVIKSEDVKALAELPPLEVLRAQLLGTIMAPASKLARTLAEPGRSLAAVLQARVDKEGAPAPAETAAA